MTSFDTLITNNDRLLRGIYSYGYENASVIQERAIPVLLSGKDAICQAQAGSGKTAAFVLSALSIIDYGQSSTQVIVTAPTRELATQICSVFEALGAYLKGVKAALCIGGTPLRDSIDAARGAQVVVGTPGRLNAMIDRDVLSMGTVRLVVADECDQLLDDDFVDQLRGIISATGKDVQIALFSATITPAVEKVSTLFMNDPAQLRVTEDNLTLSGIRQYYVEVDDRYKMETLFDLYAAINVTQAIVYSHSRAKVEHIYETMTENGFPVSMIHGGMSSSERGDVMKDFRAGKARILVCTDLMARGIDVQTVGIVLNFDMPRDKETYLHRIGRSGRFGRKGVAITFVTQGDVRKIREIEDFYSTEITEMPEPEALDMK